MSFSFTTVGPTALTLRYSAGNGTARRNVTLDGAPLAASQSFPATSSWSAWSNVALNVNLGAGRHILTVAFDQESGSTQYLNLDNLRVSSTLVVPARTAARNIGTESRWSNSVSAPYVCCWIASGQYVTFSFNAVGGATNLALRYSAGNGTAHRKVQLDGTVAVANETFRGTPGWSTWSNVSLNAKLTKGRHTLKVWLDPKAGSGQYMNIDNLSVKAG